MQSVKLLALVFTIFVVVQAEVDEEHKKAFMGMTEECRTKHGATDDDINTIMAKKIPETKTAKCTATCIGKQFKTVKQNGDYLEMDCEAMGKWVQAAGAKEEDQKVASEICEKCKAPGIPDECEFSGAVAVCMKNECDARGITM